MLYAAHINEALYTSEVCLRKALDLVIRTRRQLRAAEVALGCCSLTHTAIFRTEGEGCGRVGGSAARVGGRAGGEWGGGGGGKGGRGTGSESDT